MEVRYRKTGLTVNLAEHLPHALDVVEVQEPGLGIPIVFLKRYGKAGYCPIKARAKAEGGRVGGGYDEGGSVP